MRNPKLELFGAVIRHRREDLDRTQAQVAADVGVVPSTISSWERGKLTRLVRPGDYQRLCRALRFDPVELFRDIEYALDHHQPSRRRAA